MKENRVHFKLSLSFVAVGGGDTTHGGLHWLVSTPASDNLKCTRRIELCYIITFDMTKKQSTGLLIYNRYKNIPEVLLAALLTKLK